MRNSSAVQKNFLAALSFPSAHIFEKTPFSSKDHRPLLSRSFSFVSQFVPSRPVRNGKKQNLRRQQKKIRLHKWFNNHHQIAKYKRILLFQQYGIPLKLRSGLIKWRVRIKLRGRKKTTQKLKFVVKRLALKILASKSKYQWFSKKQTNKKLSKWTLFDKKAKKKIFKKKLALWFEIYKDRPACFQRAWRYLLHSFPNTKIDLKKVRKSEETSYLGLQEKKTQVLKWYERKKLDRPIFNYIRRSSGWKPGRPWKYRNIRWRFFESQRRRRFGQNQLGRWAVFHLFPYKLYRRVHQPYRYRRANKLKKNKGFFLLKKAFQRHRIVGRRARSQRLRARQLFNKLYRSFYGLAKQKVVKQWFRKLQKIDPTGRSKRNLAWSSLEKKLDVTLCRIRLAPTIKIARLLIHRGYIWVNKKQIINPQLRINVWDIIEINKAFEPFVRYWVVRSKFQRAAFKNKGLKSRFIFAQHSALTFGFWTKEPFSHDLPPKDLTKIGDIERLFLYA